MSTPSKSSPKKHAHAHLSLRTARSCGTLHANELAECVCVAGTTRYGSKDRLIFEFSVVLDLDGDDFDIRDYPGEAADNATADLRRRIAGTKVGRWGVFVVTVTGRPRRSSDRLSVSP